MTSSSSTEATAAEYAATLHDAFAAAAATELREHDLRVAGVRIRISLAGIGLRPMLAPLLLEPARDAPVDGVVRVWDDASTRSRLPAFPWLSTDIGRQGAVTGWSGDRLRFVYHGNVMEPPTYGFNALSAFDEDTREALFWAADADRLPWAETLEPLRPSLHWLLGSLGRHMLHAGAVTTSHGGAVLAGGGFAGKTTTSMACVQAGFGFVGDNYVVLTPKDGLVDCLFPNIKLRRDSLCLLPRISALRGVGDRAVYDVPPKQVTRSAEVRAVLVVRRGASETRVVPAPASAALTALAPSTIYQLPANAGIALKAIGELLRRVPTHFLDVGPDPATAPSVIADVLERA